jgi:hypothetical protein
MGRGRPYTLKVREWSIRNGREAERKMWRGQHVFRFELNRARETVTGCAPNIK